MPQIDLDRVAGWLTEQDFFCSVTSLKRDGSPVVRTLGFLYRDGYVYWSIGAGRLGINRIRRDPRVAVCICDAALWPPMALHLNGVAEEVADPGDGISREIVRRYIEPRAPALGIDYETYEENNVAQGRVVFRIPINDDTAWFHDGEAMRRAVDEGRASWEVDAAGSAALRHLLGSGSTPSTPAR